MTRPWRNLAFTDWPEADRVAWLALLRDGDVLDGRGAGAHWSEATAITNRKHYAGWLGWLQWTGALTDSEQPVDRVTPQRVEAYARALLDCVASTTVASYVRDLKVVALALAPEGDWRWLTQLSNRLKNWATPSRPKWRNSITAPEVFKRCVAELHMLSGDIPKRQAANRAYRDTLMIAVLVCAPVRLKNLAMIDIGTHLVELKSQWQLRFADHETKNRQALRYELPEMLSDPVDHYICEVRPSFLGALDSNAFWFGQKGARMAEITIYNAVVRTSKRLFCEPLYPHAFRSIAATLLAETSPEDALHARPLLGHRQAATTENHYIRACQIKASRNVASALQQIKLGVNE